MKEEQFKKRLLEILMSDRQVNGAEKDIVDEIIEELRVQGVEWLPNEFKDCDGIIEDGAWLPKKDVELLPDGSPKWCECGCGRASIYCQGKEARTHKKECNGRCYPPCKTRWEKDKEEVRTPKKASETHTVDHEPDTRYYTNPDGSEMSPSIARTHKKSLIDKRRLQKIEERSMEIQREKAEAINKGLDKLYGEDYGFPREEEKIWRRDLLDFIQGIKRKDGCLFWRQEEQTRIEELRRKYT